MAWVLAVVTNLVIGVVAYALAWQIARNLLNDRQWPSNRLAVAMLAIVGTCATGHLEHWRVAPSGFTAGLCRC